MFKETERMHDSAGSAGSPFQEMPRPQVLQSYLGRKPDVDSSSSPTGKFPPGKLT